MTIDGSLSEHHHHECADGWLFPSCSLRGTSGPGGGGGAPWQRDQPLSRELFVSPSSAPTPGMCLASSRSSPASLPQRDSRDKEVFSSLTQAN